MAQNLNITNIDITKKELKTQKINNIDISTDEIRVNTRLPEKENPNLSGGGSIINVHGTRYPAKINREKQNRHIVGTAQYHEGRSIFSGKLKDANDFLLRFGGNGTKINSYKERVNFGLLLRMELLILQETV